jgi:hypothetical protein
MTCQIGKTGVIHCYDLGNNYQPDSNLGLLQLKKQYNGRS